MSLEPIATVMDFGAQVVRSSCGRFQPSLSKFLDGECEGLDVHHLTKRYFFKIELEMIT